MPNIAPTAHVDPGAQIADDVTIGHHCVIGPKVVLGSGCILYNNVTIIGRTTVGARNSFYQNVVIGAAPQDLKYRGGETELIIGDDNVFRENMTVHPGTEAGGGRTVIGNHNLFMIGVHVAHDCRVADRVIVANNAMLAGHVHVEPSVVIGGGAGFHHFVTIGRNAMIGGMARVPADVPPFMIFEGNPGTVRGVNAVGLARSGFSADQIEVLKHAYKRLFRSRESVAALDELTQTNGQDPNIRYLVEFVRRMHQGRYGRYLESQRTDSAEDVSHFYKEEP